MMAAAPIQAEVTHSTARAVYNRVFERLRERHNAPATRTRQAETWHVAAAHVVMGLMEWEAVAVLRYLLAQGYLPAPDVALAEALAARLHVRIVFAQKELVE